MPRKTWFPRLALSCWIAPFACDCVPLRGSKLRAASRREEERRRRSRSVSEGEAFPQASNRKN
jgi:hypothetical protein